VNSPSSSTPETVYLKWPSILTGSTTVNFWVLGSSSSSSSSIISVSGPLNDLKSPIRDLALSISSLSATLGLTPDLSLSTGGPPKLKSSVLPSPAAAEESIYYSADSGTTGLMYSSASG